MEKQNKVADVKDAEKKAPQTKPFVPPAEAAKIRPAAPAFKIVSAKQRKRYLNALIYGDYGVGKTTLSATAAEVPEMQRAIFVSAEAGDESIKDFDLDIVDISNFAQFARVHEFLRLHCRLRDAWVEAKDEESLLKLKKLEAMFTGADVEDINEPNIYKTVIVDSLTEVQKYCMYQLLGIQVGSFALDMEPETPQWAEWGKSAEMIRLLVRSFRDLPMNTIFVCARAEDQDHAKRYHYKPLLPGKLANEVQAFFDVVGYLIAAPTEGGDMHRRLWLEPGQTFQAKNRFRNFDGRYLDNPSMADLVKFKLV